MKTQPFRKNLMLVGFWVCLLGAVWGGGISAIAATGCDGNGNCYISQSGSGGGTSCSDTRSVAWLNTASNWGTGASQIGAGGTVHLCGTISTGITVQGSGTSGNPITIYFEPNAMMSAPAFAQAINVGTYNYITINGGLTASGGPNGIIQDTANGSALANQVISIGVAATGASNLTVENLNIKNMYVHSSSSDTSNAAQYSTGISNDTTSNSWTNFTVLNNTINDATIGIWGGYYGTVTGVNWGYNTIYNVNWGMAMGDNSSSASASNVTIHNNHVYSFANWDDNIDQFHHNGWFGWANNGTLSNVYVYDNIFGPNFGNNATAAIYDTGNVSNMYYYNNILLENVNDGPDDGLIALQPNNNNPGHYIFNNTFIGQSQGSGYGNGIDIDGNAPFVIENNLFSGINTPIFYAYVTQANLVSNYNLFYNFNPGYAFTFSSNSSGSSTTLAQWQAMGYDTHSVSANPDLSSTYTLQSGSPAIGAGVNLTSLGISTLDTDMAGLLRPTSLPWDIGAYQYSSSTNTTPPSAPQNLRIK